MSRRRRWRARDVSVWDIARVASLVCRWCTGAVIQGSVVLFVGPTRLVCCRVCALQFRGVTPPPALTQSSSSDVDPRMLQLPESER